MHTIDINKFQYYCSLIKTPIPVIPHSLTESQLVKTVQSYYKNNFITNLDQYVADYFSQLVIFIVANQY